ncbi:release factor glutamine methyltransferase [Salana multivorans]|uniref:Release factor glutamine methyltransferase n=1 Tax=Salana multivorans TaxID=120377 RepID=A0A3N2D8F1_9MICO|nr:putative protein N(5)-glutamine methyltransferase [Salana multivorans]ROR96061.1 release factor glutamine methyltransferase [Salana multivorans]
MSSPTSWSSASPETGRAAAAGDPPAGDPSAADLVARLRAAGCVFAEDEARLLGELPEAGGAREAAVRRRVAGERLEHVLGWAELSGVRIAVTPGVFVPRRRTEALVAVARRLLAPGGVLLEVCCGSGAIARVLAELCGPARVHASDVDPRAVACAERNLAGWGDVSVADVVDGVPTDLRGRVTLLVANVPYVPTDELDLLPRDARDGEPRRTHDGGDDGLDVLRRVLAAAGEWLAPGGATVSELAPGQGAAAIAAAVHAGLAAHAVLADDEDGAGTLVLVARRP